MSILNSIGNGLLNLILPLIKPVLKSLLKTVFNKLKEKDVTLYKEVLTELYVPVDVHLETLADKTETEIDNVVVDALKETIEECAQDVNLTLPNLDED